MIQIFEIWENIEGEAVCTVAYTLQGDILMLDPRTALAQAQFEDDDPEDGEELTDAEYEEERARANPDLEEDDEEEDLESDLDDEGEEPPTQADLDAADEED